MIEKAAISLNYIKKSPLPGSDKGLRYMLRSEERKPEAGNEGQEGGEEQKPVKVMAVYAWPEPLCFAKTDPELIKSRDFSLNDKGLEEAIEWLNSRPVDAL